jgi:hypothetical protein
MSCPLAKISRYRSHWRVPFDLFSRDISSCSAHGAFLVSLLSKRFGSSLSHGYVKGHGPFGRHLDRDLVTTDLTLVDAILVEQFEEFVIVAVVDTDADDHRPVRIERLLHDRSDIVGSVDH